MELAQLLTTRLRTVPETEQASALANVVRDAAREHRQMASLLLRLGWTVDEHPLQAADGGLEAVMAPKDGGFVFVVDPEPTPDQKRAWGHLPTDEVRAHVVNSRLAHELGHVFFYGLDGRRLLRASRQEEAFCDAFADMLFPAPG